MNFHDAVTSWRDVNDIIPVSSSARNLGFIFDSDMSFSDQIKSVSKSCHFHIRDIRRIRHLLPLSAATALANSLVSSKLDYCNSLYSGISQANLNKLQRIQNSLARVIKNTSKYQHITPIFTNALTGGLWGPICDNRDLATIRSEDLIQEEVGAK